MNVYYYKDGFSSAEKKLFYSKKMYDVIDYFFIQYKKIEIVKYKFYIYLY